MQFREIVGHEDTKQRLRQAVQEGRVPHAMLFTGMQGVGKLQMAIAFAQYLSCPNRTAEDSCGVCPTCKQYRSLQHPDLHFAYPVIKPEGAKEVVCDDYGKEWRELLVEKPYFDLDEWYERMGAGNKQGMIYEKESSEILRKLSLKAFGNGYKVMIIWLPEKMNDVCANKLLKIIEEPPQMTLFMLVSEQPQQLLQTILSRVQQVPLNKLTEEDICSALREMNDELSAADAVDFAHVANGSLLAGIRLMQQNSQLKSFFEAFQKLMRNAWLVGHKQNYASLLDLRAWSQDMASAGREKQKAFLDYCLKQIRENYITNYTSAEAIYQTASEREFSTRFAPFINSSNIEALVEQFSLAQRQIEQNGNPKMIFFDLFLQLIVLIK